MKITTPKANISHLNKSKTHPLNISGAVYPGVPPGGFYIFWVILANPKSHNFNL